MYFCVVWIVNLRDLNWRRFERERVEVIVCCVFGKFNENVYIVILNVFGEFMFIKRCVIVLFVFGF